MYLIQNKYPEVKLLTLWLQVNGFKYYPLFFNVENQNGSWIKGGDGEQQFPKPMTISYIAIFVFQPCDSPEITLLSKRFLQYATGCIETDLWSLNNWIILQVGTETSDTLFREMSSLRKSWGD